MTKCKVQPPRFGAALGFLYTHTQLQNRFNQNTCTSRKVSLSISTERCLQAIRRLDARRIIMELIAAALFKNKQFVRHSLLLSTSFLWNISSSTIVPSTTDYAAH